MPPTSSTPANPPSSSYKEGDTSLVLAALATPHQTPKSAPYSSEGPTLPLLDGASERASLTTTTISSDAAGAERERARKRSRVGVDVAVGDDVNGDDEALKKRKKESKGNNGVDMQILHTPWLLLPPDVRGAWDWRDGACTTVVYTRNQNIRSGVNRLKKLLLDAEEGRDEGGRGKDGGTAGSGGVMAVSAQGEATTKLVGILEVVRRVVCAGEGEKVKWWMYTCLSSRTIDAHLPEEKRTNEKGPIAADEAQAEDEDEDEDTNMPDVDLPSKPQTTNSAKNPTPPTKSKPKTKTIPVLTVYLTRKRNAVFAKAFGEQSLDVVAGEA